MYARVKEIVFPHLAFKECVSRHQLPHYWFSDQKIYMVNDALVREMIELTGNQDLTGQVVVEEMSVFEVCACFGHFEKEQKQLLEVFKKHGEVRDDHAIRGRFVNEKLYFRQTCAKNKAIQGVDDRPGQATFLKEYFLPVKTALELLGEIGDRHGESRGHIERLAKHVRTMANLLGIDTHQRIIWMLGARLHDCGKIWVPEKILTHPGKLNSEQWEIIRRHPTDGEKYFLKTFHSVLGDVVEDIAKIIGSHHERFDGSGYPRQTSGEEIPLGGRVVAIADVFDALMSKRPYKEAFELSKSLSLLKKERGQHFDPQILDLFLEYIQKHRDNILAIYK